ncbi:hypothetical protein B296_00023877 [Ensete ventricosum]|uniref:Uncharacterized protein n=1 Tax=Ensete ventricosum TaxID=4639 RepID=A0A426Z5U5_ENSVE|nr:hypothetical protein B296_00023877 [Ensete ventricosum]
MLRLDYTPPPYAAPWAAEILRRRSEFLGPLHAFVRRSGCNILPFSICTTPWRPSPGNQLGSCLGITKYTSSFSCSIYVSACSICTRFTGRFFTNSVTEADELAMMIARLYTDCHDIISPTNARTVEDEVSATWPTLHLNLVLRLTRMASVRPQIIKRFKPLPSSDKTAVDDPNAIPQHPRINPLYMCGW